MTLKRLFVIVPSLLPAGPIKGAAALCNGLAARLPVTLVVLKNDYAAGVHVDSEIEILSLGHLGSWWKKIRVLKAALRKAGKPGQVASISFCLSADATNFFMKPHALIASSVRGNLPQNYNYDYGPLGRVAAWLHLIALHHFDRVVVMSTSMAKQLKRFGHKQLVVIGNFVDEIELESYRDEKAKTGNTVRFIFLASLSRRKRPDILVTAARELQKLEYDFHIDMVGTGPLEQELRDLVYTYKIDSRVTFHGQVAKPYKILQQADCLVLPSESEGVPRAGLEALYFGIPCILRDIDANRELIIQGCNGDLFQNDKDLATVMARAIDRADSYRQGENLLPPQFRQQNSLECYLRSISQ